MNVLRETPEFIDWLERLKDEDGKVRILARIRSAGGGNFGDCKALGDGVSEMRIHFGPGYRIYYGREGLEVYLLVLGGAKSTQSRDIRQAKKLWKTIREAKDGENP